MRFKRILPLALVTALVFPIIASPVLNPTIVAEAAVKKLPDNHQIQQLDVEFVGKEGEYGNYLINVGDQKGTLLIRIDPPKVARNVEWVNWVLEKRSSVPFNLYPNVDPSTHKNVAPISFGHIDGYDFITRGEPEKWGKESGRERIGVVKFSGHSTPPTYYLGLSVYLPKKYNSDGIYYFTGSAYALKEAGQVKAYFFKDVDVVTEAYDRVADKTGTFPLMNKVMWGKTELWNGQLGKVSVKNPTTLWSRTDDGKLTKVRELKAGDEFRVYRYLDQDGGLYGVGSGMFVQKDSTKIVYETPSKKNLRLIKIMHGEE